MGRYLLATVNTRDARGSLKALVERARRSELTSDWLGARTVLVRGGPRPPALHRVGQWMLIGDVISRRGADDGVPAEGKAGSIDALFRRHWGRYVGARLDAAGAVAEVLRDPSGAHEAIVWEAEGLTFVASDHIEELDHEIGLCWTVNLDRLSSAMRSPLMVWDRLLLDGPVAVPPGAHLSLPPIRPPVAVWSPDRFARAGFQRPLKDQDAARVLREAVVEAVEGFASLSPKRGVEISGGLDSSIVAAVLRRRGFNARLWLHEAGCDGDSDEGAFVSALAQTLDVSPTMHKRRVRPIAAADLEGLSPGIRPGLNALDAEHGRAWAAQWRGAGVDLVLTGKGGDSLFVQAADAHVFADLWQDRGPAAIFDRSLPRLARWNERSVWDLVRTGLTGKAADGLDGDPRPEPLLPCGRPIAPHPWLALAQDLGPAKRYQIAGVINGLMFSAASAQTRVADLCHPLLAQPVVEACLALPIFQLTLGRRDRALAREAFRDLLPTIIADRRSKGDLTAVYGRTLALSLPTLRDWLVGGRLAALALVDRNRLEARLTRDGLMHQGGYGEIMRLAAFESWIRNWEAHLARRSSPASPERPWSHRATG